MSESKHKTQPQAIKVLKRLTHQVTGLTNFLTRGAFVTMKRISQRTSYHCGPAVVEMLFSYLGFATTQKDVVKAAKVTKRLRKYGMLVKEMGLAVNKLGGGNFKFWYKTNSTSHQISEIINKYGYPVGVEWQGFFAEDEYGDNGHYSVVTALDLDRGVISIADPYVRFAGRDRKFKVKDFEKRWWDVNTIKAPVSRRLKDVQEKRMMYIVVPASESFPRKLGMRKV